MRKLALLIAALSVLLAASFTSSLGVVAAGPAGGPDQPGPDRHAPTQPLRPVAIPSLATPATLTCDGTFHAVPSPDPSSTQGNVLSGTAAISANDVWAVGAWTSLAPYDSTLAEHWDGTAWSTVPTPNPSPGLNELFAVAAVSSSDVWAVGVIAGKNLEVTLAEHWNGSTWSVFPTPNGPGGAPSELFAVSATSSNDVWAVGHYNGSKNNTLVEHWDGSSWTVVPSPDAGTSDNQLFGVSAFGAADAWAVGYYRPSTGAARQSLAEHWNGTSWSVVPSFSQAGDTQINAVTALASGTAVGVGYARISSGAPALPFQFGLSSGGGVGGNFSVAVPTPGTGDNALRGVTVASGKVWAVGWWSQLVASPAQTLVVSADYTSGFLGQLVGGSGDNPNATGNNLLLAVTAVSRNGFWATGWSDGMFAPQTLTELNCRPHLTLTAPASTVAFTAFGLTVTAADLGGTTVAGYLGTVHFTSSDPQAVLPADYTFVPGDSGAHNFAGVMLNSVGTQTITATDTLVADIHGSITIRVTCLGACPAPAGTPGSRDTKPAPPGMPGTRSGANPSGAGSPGPRLPVLPAKSSGSAPGAALAATAGPVPSSGVAAAAAASSATQSAPPAGGPVATGASTTSVQAPAHGAVSLVALRQAVARPPDETPWSVMLLIPLLAFALALTVVRSRRAKRVKR